MPILGGCCCFDLKVGSKIIGILNLISSLISLLSTAIMLAAYSVVEDAIMDSIREQKARNNMISSIPARDASRFRDYDDDDYTDFNRHQADEALEWFKNHIGMVRVVLLVCLVVLIVDILFTSTLLHGLRKNYRKMLLPWICLHWLSVVVAVVVFTALFVFVVYFGLPAVVVVVQVVGAIVCIALQIFLVLVVTSQYQAMALIMLHNDEMIMK